MSRNGLKIGISCLFLLLAGLILLINSDALRTGENASALSAGTGGAEGDAQSLSPITKDRGF